MKLNILSRVRLMPAVILVGAGLLVMKTSGLVHEAQAAEASMAPAAQTAQIDFAGPAEQNASASQVDILTNLSQRRDELDARARDLDMRANLLAAAEKRVDDKISQIKDLQTKLADLLKQRDAEQEKQIQALVKTYSAMKTLSAAQIFASLDDDVLVPVAQEMNPEDLSKIMGAMPATAAQKLTVKLANRLALPKTVTPPVMAPEAPATTPGQQSDATPQPSTPDTAPAQKQATLAPAPIVPTPIDAKTPPAAKPVQVAAKAPAAAAPEPVAAAKPSTKVAAAAKPQAKTDTKVDAKTDTKPDVPAQETPTAPPAPAAPPGPGH